jgi:hypothetical protein
MTGTADTESADTGARLYMYKSRVLQNKFFLRTREQDAGNAGDFKYRYRYPVDFLVQNSCFSPMNHGLH